VNTFVWELPVNNAKLLWAEEFNQTEGSAPNPEIWGRNIGDGSSYGIPGWGNNELQVYTEANAFVNAKGFLEIEARKISDGSAGDAYYGPAQWTSARLVTKDKLQVQYGQIVIKAKVPQGKGLWPAFWMLGCRMDEQGWPLAGEIDIMEWVGKKPLEALGTLHGPGYFGDNGCGGKLIATKDFSEDWHEFGISWKPDQISWQVDGETYFTATPDSVSPNQWVFNQPFYFLLNLAVGGNLGGPLDPELPDSNKLLVEYIRVYEYEGFGQVNVL
jgi:beta-glucanase (GH16 family)